MKKYYSIIKTEFQRQLTYRIENYAYRLSDLFELLALLAVWTIAYRNTGSAISGYSQAEMTTYVLVGWLFAYVGRNYGLGNHVADDIFEGRISNFLVKPISYLKHVVFLSISRSSLSLFYAVVIQGAVIFVFSKYIIFDWEPIRLTLIFLMLVVSYFINVFFGMIIGMIAFWTQRITGIDYTVGMIYRLLAGVYFPIILLPEIFLKIDKLFPFIYTMYFPANIYLGKISIEEGFVGLGVEIIWLFIFYGIIKIMWKRGIKKYEGVGI